MTKIAPIRNNIIFPLKIVTLEEINANSRAEALNTLESGNIIYFPNYSFNLTSEEKSLYGKDILAKGNKNISYNITNSKINGIAKKSSLSPLITSLMHRYAIYSQELIHTLLPHYKDTLIWGRTSYRPAEIEGRVTSKRKDDTRLHVDSFAATPVAGLRILRVFCNINPNGLDRTWNVGESFPIVLEKFFKTIPPYNKFKARILKTLKITKSLRTQYDHCMLHIHDNMKLNDEYQKNVTKNRFKFPAKTTWIVFSDQTSHAALDGQYLLEQTFYLPVSSMAAPENSPLRLIENYFCNF